MLTQLLLQAWVIKVKNKENATMNLTQFFHSVVTVVTSFIISVALAAAITVFIALPVTVVYIIGNGLEQLITFAVLGY